MNDSQGPRGLLRLFLRFPILLFRIELGWLFRDRLVLLTHTGRNSGRPRRVVVEITRLDRASRTLYILSGWGEQSNWVRNIQKTPDVLVQVGLREWPATASRLDAAQAERELLDYAARRSQAFGALAKRYGIGLPPGSAPAAICKDLAAQIPLFRLSPRTG